jgi:hypothetical protein
MVASTASRGLSAADLESIRSTLASGRKPKIVFTEAAGQIAGQTGQVVELTDPPEGEFVVVRFGRDELPFSPADLAVPSKAPVKPKPRPQPEEPTTPPADEIPYEQIAAAVPPPRQETPVPTGTAPETDTPPPALADDPKPAKKAARAAKPKPAPSLTVTLSYTDGEWMVGAQQGTKALAKPYVIKAAEALRMVSLLDVPGVHEAVEHIVDAERTETQAQAERLRAELAEIEARLADLPDTAH